MCLRAGESEVVGETLNASGFSDGERAVLIWMDVPVSVLRDVRRDRATELRPAESLVLVREDVGPVPAQPLRQIDVGLPLAEEPEGLHVVRSNISADVFEHDAALVLGKLLAHQTLIPRGLASRVV